MQACDLGVVRHVAHALKGTLAMFGARPASDCALELERMAASGERACCMQGWKHCSEKLNNSCLYLPTHERPCLDESLYGSGAKVLIVDDTEINLILFAALIKKLDNCVATTFSNATQGFQWAAAQSA